MSETEIARMVEKVHEDGSVDVAQGEARMDELVEEFPDDAVTEPAPLPANSLAIARSLGLTAAEARDSLRHPRISFELPLWPSSAPDTGG